MTEVQAIIPILKVEITGEIDTHTYLYCTNALQKFIVKHHDVYSMLASALPKPD
jgi:hypothetical protein